MQNPVFLYVLQQYCRSSCVSLAADNGRTRGARDRTHDHHRGERRQPTGSLHRSNFGDSKLPKKNHTFLFLCVLSHKICFLLICTSDIFPVGTRDRLRRHCDDERR